MLQYPTQSQPRSLAQCQMSQAESDRSRKMDEAQKAYDGDFPKPLKVKKDQPDDNVLSNRCSAIVDKGVSFLFGQSLQIEVEHQEEVDQIWGDDDTKMTLLSKIGMNGGIFGQAFVKLIPPTGNQTTPRLVNLDTRTVRIISLPEDCDVHLAYLIEYGIGNGTRKRQVIARVDPDRDLDTAGPNDLQDYWTITNYVRRHEDRAWSQVGEQEVWPYPFAPVFCCQNLPNPNEASGKPDLTPDLIQLNKVLNFTQSNTSRIIKFHAQPKTWGKGFRASQVNTAIDDVFIIEAPDGTLQNLEMTSDLSSSRAFAADVRADMDEQSRVPGVALGRLAEMPKGQISGIALKLLFQPLTEKTTQKRRLFGSMIRSVTRAALVLLGLVPVQQWEQYPVELHWQEVLPSDQLQEAQEAILLKQLDVSASTILQRLGFDPEEEAEKKAEEDARQVTLFSQGRGMPPAQSLAPDQQGDANAN